MRPGLSKRISAKKYGRLIRLAALFFLLHAGADMFLPQYFCSGEMGGLPASTRVLASTGADDLANDLISRSGNTGEENSPEGEAPHEEDCFCCCAHVLPSLGFDGDITSEPKSVQAAPSTDSLPSPPLQGTYHPPRIA